MESKIIKWDGKHENLFVKRCKKYNDQKPIRVI